MCSGIRNEWNSRAINDLADSYYQEWTYEDRKLLEFTCQAGFLFSVVVVQWMTAIQARSRKYSMVQKPLNNHVLNFAIIFETVLALLIIYIPGNSEVSNTDREILSLISNFSLFRDSSWPQCTLLSGGCQGWPSPSSWSATRS